LEELRDRPHVLPVDLAPVVGKVFPVHEVGMNLVRVVALRPQSPAVRNLRPAPALVLQLGQCLDLVAAQ
jgi:hypothetical protein